MAAWATAGVERRQEERVGEVQGSATLRPRSRRRLTQSEWRNAAPVSIFLLMCTHLLCGAVAKGIFTTDGTITVQDEKSLVKALSDTSISTINIVKDIDLDGVIPITSDVELKSPNGATIKASASNAGFSVSSFVTLRLENLIVVGYDPTACYNAASLCGTDSFLTASPDSTISIFNVSFTGLASTHDGSAIYAQGDLIISKSSFQSCNNENTGGAISVQAKAVNKVAFDGVSFIGNIARQRGGAAYLEAGVVEIDSSSFSLNFANLGDGGALHVTASVSFKSTNNQYNANFAGFGGGAVQAVGKSNFFIGDSIEQNQAAFGGGVAGSTIWVERTYFANNSATLQAAAVFASGPLTVKNVNISGFSIVQTDGGAIVSRSKLQMDTVHITNVENLNGHGNALVATNDVEATNCIFEGNFATSGPAIRYEASPTSVGHFKGCVFRGNQARAVGGAIAHYVGKMILEDCIFEYNTAKAVGGGAVAAYSDLDVINCTFTGNQAPVGGAVFSQGSTGKLAPIMLEACHIQGNSATGWGGGVLSVASFLHVTGSQIVANDASDGGGIALRQSQGLVEDSTIASNSALVGGGGVMAELSQVVFNSSTLLANYAHLGGGIFISEKDNVTVSFCTLDSNIAVEQGGGILNAGLSRIVSSTFLNNTAQDGGALFNFDEGDTRLYNSTFSSNSALRHGGVIANAAVAQISNCTMRENTAGSYGGALFVGAGLLAEEMADEQDQACFYEVGMYMEDVLIRDCKAANGAGVYVDAVSCASAASTTLARVTFVNNTAQNGGGMFSDCVNGSSSCTTLNQVSFLSNIAAGGGGGALLTTEAPLLSCGSSLPNLTFDGCADWQRNQAIQDGYGDTVATDAVGIQPLYSVIDGQAPGQPISNLMLRVVDKLNQTVTAGTDSTLALSVFISPVSPDSDPNPTLDGQISVGATLGVGRFTDLSIYAKPGAYNLSFTTPAAAVNMWTSVLVVLRNCSKGEIIGNRSCVVCGAPLFSWDPQQASCDACPDNAICNGGDIVVPVDGFWHSSRFSPQFISCQSVGACSFTRDGVARAQILMESLKNLSATDDWERDVQCGEGYESTLCAKCVLGYGMYQGGGHIQCKKCPSLTVVIVLYVVLFILNITLIVFTVRFAMDSDGHAALVIKLLMSHMQFLTMLLNANVPWPNLISFLTTFMLGLAQTASTWSSLGCAPLSNQWSRAYQGSLIAAAIPFIATGVVFLFWFIRYLIVRPDREQESLWSWMSWRLESTIFVVFFFLYPGIVQQIVMMFSCLTIDAPEPGTYAQYLKSIGSYWQLDMSIKCFEGTHLLLSMTVGVAMIILFGLGVPTTSYLVLRKKRHSLEAAHTFETYGFLYDGYKKRRFYWWESVVLVEKFVLVFISAFFQIWGGNMVLVSFQATVIVFLALHLACAPFETHILNNAQTLSWLCLSACTPIGFLAAQGDLSGAGAIIASLAVLAANLVFVGFMLWNYSRLFVEEAREYVRSKSGKESDSLIETIGSFAKLKLDASLRALTEPTNLMGSKRKYPTVAELRDDKKHMLETPPLSPSKSGKHGGKADKALSDSPEHGDKKKEGEGGASGVGTSSSSGKNGKKESASSDAFPFPTPSKDESSKKMLDLGGKGAKILSGASFSKKRSKEMESAGLLQGVMKSDLNDGEHDVVMIKEHVDEPRDMASVAWYEDEISVSPSDAFFSSEITSSSTVPTPEDWGKRKGKKD